MNCCNDYGRCDRGLGCPAGPACHGSPDCQDTACPGRPARRVKPYPSTPSDAGMRITMEPSWRDLTPPMVLSLLRLLLIVALAVGIVVVLVKP